MVLCLKARESRSLPSLPNAKTFPIDDKVLGFAAGWSSPVARQAHNLKVVGSNPAPATTTAELASVADKAALLWAAFLLPPFDSKPSSTIRQISPTSSIVGPSLVG